VSQRVPLKEGASHLDNSVSKGPAQPHRIGERERVRARGQDTHLSSRIIQSQEVLLAPHGDADCKDRSRDGKRAHSDPGSGAISLPPWYPPLPAQLEAGGRAPWKMSPPFPLCPAHCEVA
jgi:hypothetical protein